MPDWQHLEESLHHFPTNYIISSLKVWIHLQNLFRSATIHHSLAPSLECPLQELLHNFTFGFRLGHFLFQKLSISLNRYPIATVKI